MTLEIRRLDPTNDQWLFRVAHNWLVESPSWRRDTEAVFGTLDRTAYLTATHDDHRIDIGIFLDNQLEAIVTFTLRAKGVFEVHLEAARRADAVTIATAGCIIRDQIFAQGAQLVYAWVPRRNSAVRTILHAIGFRADNVSMFRTTPQGKVTEWIKLSIGADYGQQETEHHPNANAGSQQCEHVRLDDAA